MLRLRSRTFAMSIAKPSSVMPNSLLRRKYDATFALWRFLLGKHAMFGHDPPMYLRSTTATRFPSPAKLQGSNGRARATPENHQIKFFRLRRRKYLSGRGVFGALHATFPF